MRAQLKKGLGGVYKATIGDSSNARQLGVLYSILVRITRLEVRQTLPGAGMQAGPLPSRCRYCYWDNKLLG